MQQSPNHVRINHYKLPQKLLWNFSDYVQWYQNIMIYHSLQNGHDLRFVDGLKEFFFLHTIFILLSTENETIHTTLGTHTKWWD